MKFLPSEHQAFKTLIERSDFAYDTFSFVKKKGWLNIDHENLLHTFRFHRRDEERLDDAGKWTDSKTYSVNIGQETMTMEAFEGVLTAFERWLAESK